MKNLKYLLLAVVVLSSVSCKEYFRKKALMGVGIDSLLIETEPEPVIEIEQVEEVPIVEEEPEPVIIEPIMGYSSDRYYMVVGSFLSEKLAVKYANTIIDMGYQPNVIHSPSEGYYRVTARSYSDRTTAINDIQNFRSDVTSYAWVHVKN